IEPTKEYATGITVTSIKPEPVEISVKIILIGSSFYYDLLSAYDEEFHKCFKYRVLFDYEMPYNQKNSANFAAFIKQYARQTGLLPFDFSAVAALLAYAMRLSESQQKLSTRFGHLSELMTEASAWAEMDGKSEISAADIQKAIDEKGKRVDLYEEKLSEMIDENIIMIDTDGAKTAQINGLAVIETDGHIFAKPTRITATTYIGKAGVVNIEKEAEMSGSIHDKGIEVLTGYLGQIYAQEFPLSLSCRICFEQNYSGIDGDSASSTELYAVLSSLSETPIRQDIAVTGSINQIGEIQAIGGVTYKIEGFFDLCKKRGLTGRQGVVIPAANSAELNLKDDVIAAVKDGVFHIYTIQTIDEGIELLTGVPAGTKNDKGKYPPNSIHGMVYKKLKDFYRKSIAQ
ncbi:MAG: AAA family ATPase, partial [Clostridiales bacterium]|nr:AAA family ATPase [Clostridiales bacterium]